MDFRLQINHKPYTVVNTIKGEMNYTKITYLTTKVAVSRDFLEFIYFVNQNHLDPPAKLGKKWFSYTIRFRGDICKISDSAQANTARGQKN